MTFGPMLLSPSDPNQVPGLVLAEVTGVSDGLYDLTFRSTAITQTVKRARAATMMAGNRRGSYYMPEVHDEVVVGFELGDLSRPIILGALWSDQDSPPSQADTSSSNNIRTLVSRSGHEITFDDSSSPKITIKSQGGLLIEIRDSPTPKITIKTNDGGVSGSKIELDGVAWNHQHATGVGPSGPPVSITPVP